MENFLRLSIKINRVICILIILLSAVTYIVDLYKSREEAMWGIAVSMSFCVLLIVLSLIAKKGLKLIIKDDDQLKAFRVMRLGMLIALCMFVVCVIGMALGISTGAFSYLYLILALSTGFYLFSMWNVSPSKADVTQGNEEKDFIEPMLDVVNEIPDTDFGDLDK